MPVFTVEHQRRICIDGCIEPLSQSENTPHHDTAGSGGRLVFTIKSSLTLITSNSFINSHRGHRTQSFAA